MRVRKPGGPETLQVSTEPEPELQAGELLIEVRATALNRADLLQRRGLYPPPPGASDILGLECSGVVCALGEGADPAWLGQRVMALLPGGGYAERVAVPQRTAVAIPANLDFVQAAAVPEAFMTANEALFQRAQLQPLERVLVHAAAGGVGSAAVQLAHSQGAHVVGVASGATRCQFVRDLGVQCIDRSTQDLTQTLVDAYGPTPLHVILDFVGAQAWAKHAELLAPAGRLVILGGLGGSAPAQVDFGALLRRQQSVLGMVMRTRSLVEKIALTRRFERAVLPLLEQGSLRPVIDSVYPLEQVAAAHQRMEQNQNLGKIVLTL